jgi:hypothetical protein
MKNLWRGIVPLIVSVAVASCGDDSGTDPEPMEEPDFPADFATSYSLVADARPSIPHPQCIEVYCSPGSAADYSSSNYPLAEGTILVKEMRPDFQCSGNPTGWVSMRKLATGASPVTGDWYWQELDANRNVTHSNDKGNIESCTGCHVDCSLTDDWTCIDPGTRQ